MPVFVTFVTAGYPNTDMTVDIMLAMEAGGADVIELGVPFSDPIADGPAIQESNVVRPHIAVLSSPPGSAISIVRFSRSLCSKMSMWRRS